MMRSVPGLNAVHVINGLRMNDKVDADGVPILPRIRLQKIDGWNNRPNMEARRTQFVGRPMRESVLQTQLDGKPIVYSGIIEARSQDELEEYMGQINYAFSEVSEQKVIVEPYYYDAQYFFYAQIDAFDPPEETPSSLHVRYPFSRQFTLGLYMTDPRKYGEPIEWFPGSNSFVELPEYEGGLTPPLTPNLTLPPQEQASLLEAPFSEATGIWVYVDGSAPTEPIIQAIGDLTGTIDISNATTNRRLRATPIGVGSNIYVDFRERTLSFNFDDRIDNVTSDWWDPGVFGLEPGWNLIRGAKSVKAWPAYF